MNWFLTDEQKMIVETAREIAIKKILPVREKYDRLIAEGLTPTRRWGRPEDVAMAVGAVAQGRLDFCTGQVINVDGGFHLRRL